MVTGSIVFHGNSNVPSSYKSAGDGEQLEAKLSSIAGMEVGGGYGGDEGGDDEGGGGET